MAASRVNPRLFLWTGCTTTAQVLPWAWPCRRHRTRRQRSVRGSRQTQLPRTVLGRTVLALQQRHRMLSGQMQMPLCQRRSPNTRHRAAIQDTRLLPRHRRRLTATKPSSRLQFQPQLLLRPRRRFKRSITEAEATLLLLQRFHQRCRCRLRFRLPPRRRSRHSTMEMLVPRRLGRRPVEWHHLPRRRARQLSSSLEFRLLLLRRRSHNRSTTRQFQAVGGTCLRALSSGRISFRRTRSLGQRSAPER